MSIRIYAINEQENVSTKYVFYVGFGKLGGGNPIANFAAFLTGLSAEKLAILPIISLKLPALK